MKRLLLLLLIPMVMADQYIINSQDWTDVYSGMMLARFTGNTGTFIVNEGHGLQLQDQIPPGTQAVVIESVESPYIRSYHLNLQARGVDAEVRYAEESFNLAAARDLDVDGFVILDPRYSYNAVAVAPYAARKNFYVIFADAGNIDQVTPIVGDKPVIIYGFVDREVTAAFTNPVIVNKGDKFSNNLELLKMFVNEFGATQLVLTSGTFLEPQFFAPTSPVLLIGQTNVPQQTLEYLRGSDIKHAVVVGYDIFDNAVTLKNQAGLRIIVKFAKGVDSQQYALDMYPLPQARLKIGINSVVYNKYSKKLEVTYFNTGDTPAFIKSSHSILANNVSVGVVGDDDTLFIDGVETLTVAYDIELSEETGLVARSSMLYGEDRSALEYLDIVETPIETTDYEDNTDVEISDAYYDTRTKRFRIKIRNTGGSAVYVKPLVTDAIVENRQQIIGGSAQRIEQGRSAELTVKARLTPEDIADMEKITVGARYGRREMGLVNYVERSFDFRASYVSGTVLAGVGAAVIIVAIIIFLILRRNRQSRRLSAAPRKR